MLAMAKKAAVSLYELLRVAPAATDKEIRKAYLVLSRAVHPDRNPSPHAQQDFIALKKAYDILSDATKRERYDRTCLLYTSPSPRDRSLSRMPSCA